jgi:hypothetical protein
VHDELYALLGGDAEGVPALEQLDKGARDRRDRLPARGRHYGSSLPGHPLREDLVRDIA